MTALTFNRDFEPRHGECVAVSPLVSRITAPNTGPFTFHGTNTFLVGKGDLVVIDPGPEREAHIAAVIDAIGGRKVSHILVTHTHNDHSPAARAIKAHTGAPVLGEGPHRPARTLNIGEINPLDAAADSAFVPDIALEDGAAIEADGFVLEAVATPGHTANHMCYGLAAENTLFSGDHVMGWSTSIVAPPDGAMVDYMASLDRLIERNDGRLLPAHGAPIDDPVTYLAGLRAHRLEREAAVLARLSAGDTRIADMVAVIYKDVDESLHGAAGLSVLAHIEDLVARGIVASDGVASIGGRYWLSD